MLYGLSNLFFCYFFAFFLKAVNPTSFLLAPVALLVLLARTTRTEVIPANFVGMNWLCCLLRLFPTTYFNCVLHHFAGLFLFLHECSGADSWYETEDFILYRLFHFAEKAKSFFFVFNKWVTLSVRAEVHRRFQIFHRVQMFHPHHIHDLQNETFYRIVKFRLTKPGDFFHDITFKSR